jgi:hypothetical protein
MPLRSPSTSATGGDAPVRSGVAGNPGNPAGGSPPATAERNLPKPGSSPAAGTGATAPAGRQEPPAIKDALLAEIRNGKRVFYNTVVAQAQKIEVSSDAVVFTFSEGQRTLRDMFEQQRGWLEALTQTIVGRRLPVSSAFAEAPSAPAATDAEAAEKSRKAALKERALADAGVQALLEVLPVEIREVEEM